ncbi:MAG: helix-turn-helix domain-containing protein [Cellulosilyticaceae bacterium]
MLKKFDRKKYTFESYNLIFDLDLGTHEKIIYLYLCKCADNNSNMSFPSYEDIAKKCSCSRRKAISSVKELANHKLILKYERREKKICMVKGKEKLIEANTSNMYYIFPEPYTDEDIRALEEEQRQAAIEIIPRKDTSFVPKISEEILLSAPYAPPLVHDVHSNYLNNLVVVVTSEEVHKLVVNYTGREISKTLANKINNYIDQLGDKLVAAAIGQAIEQGGKQLKYLYTILDSWIEKGIRTLDDVAKDNIKHEEEKKKLREKKKAAARGAKAAPKTNKFTQINEHGHNWDMNQIEQMEQEQNFKLQGES